MGKVVLGTTGRGDDWLMLKRELEARGWQVDLFDPTPRADDGGAEETLPLLHRVDLAILLATTPSERLTREANQRLVYLAGRLEQRLGPKRVVFVRERGVESPAVGTGVPELVYTPGDVASLIPRITSLLAESSLPPMPRPLMAPWRERLGFVDRSPAPELLLALAVLLAVAAPVVLLLGFQGWGGGAPSPSLEAEVAGPGTTGGITSGAAGADDASAADPASARGVQGGSAVGLPARCRLELARGVLLAPSVDCEGAGGVVVEGFRGPWHNELGTVRPDLGVVVEVVLEAGSGQSVTMAADIDNDTWSLGAGEGVERLVVVFTADGQQVELRQPGPRGGNVAVLTYGLESGS